MSGYTKNTKVSYLPLATPPLFCQECGTSLERTELGGFFDPISGVMYKESPLTCPFRTRPHDMWMVNENGWYLG